MCDCGCEAANVSGRQNFDDNIENYRMASKSLVNFDDTFIDAKRVLTYGDEDDSAKYPRCLQNVSMGPQLSRRNIGNDSLRHISDVLNSTETRGIAVVQGQIPQASTRSGCPDAASRQAPNMRLVKRKKMRLGPPPCAGTSCAPIQRKAACAPMPACWPKSKECKKTSSH